MLRLLLIHDIGHAERVAIVVGQGNRRGKDEMMRRM